jgi:hypothetical protein
MSDAGGVWCRRGYLPAAVSVDDEPDVDPAAVEVCVCSACWADAASVRAKMRPPMFQEGSPESLEVESCDVEMLVTRNSLGPSRRPCRKVRAWAYEPWISIVTGMSEKFDAVMRGEVVRVGAAGVVATGVGAAVAVGDADASDEVDDELSVDVAGAAAAGGA